MLGSLQHMYALTTVILAVGEIDGELRSAVLEDIHEHRKLCRTSNMHA